jgi:hypothetical protein
MDDATAAQTAPEVADTQVVAAQTAPDTRLDKILGLVPRALSS